MKVNLAYKFRIYPDDKQIGMIEQNFMCSNYIYNFFLGEQKNILEEIKSELCQGDMTDAEFKVKKKEWRKENSKPFFNQFHASKRLTKMIKSGDNENWTRLKLLPSPSRTYSLKSLDNAFSKMMKNGAGFPKFKSKKNKKNSYTCQVQIKLNIIHKKNDWYLIKVPSSKDAKLGHLLFNIHQNKFIEKYNNGDIKIDSYTLTKNASNEYYVSFAVVENRIEFKKKKIVEETSIGVDLGNVRPITTDRKEDYDIPLFKNKFVKHKEIEGDIIKLNQVLSKKRLENI